MARGAGHGLGGFSLRPGGRMDRSDRVGTPAYVLISVSSVSNADAFKKTLQDAATAAATFTGRLAADADKPAAWVGIAAERVVMIQFVDAEQAQAWKNSDAFKNFDAELRKSSTSTVQLVQGLPTHVGRSGRRGRGLDNQAFEPNVQDYDRLLDQRIKAVCKGC